jgi:hypothetical protein
MESHDTFFAHRKCKKETSEKLAEKPVFIGKFENSGGAQENEPARAGLNLQSTISNLQSDHGALNR